MTQNKIKSIDWNLLHTFSSNAPDIKNDQLRNVGGKFLALKIINIF